jgi:hypothetical protein
MEPTVMVQETQSSAMLDTLVAQISTLMDRLLLIPVVATSIRLLVKTNVFTPMQELYGAIHILFQLVSKSLIRVQLVPLVHKAIMLVLVELQEPVQVDNMPRLAQVVVMQTVVLNS